MRRKVRRHKWRRYEAEKKKLADLGLPPAAYEKAGRELAKKYKL